MSENQVPEPNRKLLWLLIALVTLGAGGLGFMAGRGTTTIHPAEAEVDAGLPALVIGIMAACVVVPLLCRIRGLGLHNFSLAAGCLLAVVALVVLVGLTCSAANVGLKAR